VSEDITPVTGIKPLPADPVESGWPSAAELELKAELMDVIAQQRQTNKVVMQLQLETRRLYRELTRKVDELAALVRQLVSAVTGNGHE
jgi:hypothetical protein